MPNVVDATGKGKCGGYWLLCPTCWALVNPTMPSWLSKPLSIKSICVKRKNVLVTGRGAQAREI